MSHRTRSHRMPRKRSHSLRQKMYVMFLSAFAISVVFGYYSKTKVMAKGVAETSRELLTALDKSFSTRIQITNFANHGFLSDQDYNKYKAILDVYEDTSFSRAATNYRTYGFDASSSDSLGNVWRMDVDGKNVKEIPDVAPTYQWSPDGKYIGLVTKRVVLEYRFSNNMISLVDYNCAMSVWYVEKDESINIWAIDNESGQYEPSVLQQQIADMNTEAQERPSLQSVSYPPEFWITMAVAVCSWLGLVLNMLWSYRNDKRQAREMQGLKKIQEELLRLQMRQLEAQIQANDRTLISNPSELYLIMASLLPDKNLSTKPKR